MKSVSLGINFTIFLLFFGVAVSEAFESRSWLKVLLWMVIGITFLLADNIRKPQK